MEPLPLGDGHGPRMQGSWARRTGFKSNMMHENPGTSNDTEINNAAKSGTVTTNSSAPFESPASTDTETGAVNPYMHRENGQRRGQTVPDNVTVTPALLPPPGKRANFDSDTARAVHSSGQSRVEPLKGYRDSELDVMSQSQDADDVLLAKQPHMKYEIRETPGLFPLVLYGIQHYFSIIGSLVLIPLVIVPAMGGDDKNTADVISTVLLVSGISTLLHSFFGSRLPLIQGSSFAYLAPALAIINSSDFAGITDNRFTQTMRELQGAIIISSAFQVLLGYTGLMSIFLRFINPVVVAPTVTAIGLSFFSYGFPVVGTCMEIGLPQILVVVFLALYLRKVSVFGHRVFQVYAVPLGLVITWIYAFLLTMIGVYKYHGCDWNAPASDTVSESCRRHIYTMKHCRTDASNALKTAAWIRFPYPLQWGVPTFHWRTAIIMVVVSIVASVDSVGSYHATSLLVAARAPTPGVVSRGIGLEGVTSALAGLWGIGTGATTLTENVHTIAVTKMGSRRAVNFGACVLIILSVLGKVGAFIASIPQVIVAALLCIMWAMLAALGLSNFRYSETGSSRNVFIVGFSLFLSLSVPAYFQDYGVSPEAVATVPSYLQPYTVAAHGPIHTSIEGLNFILNTLLSLNMLIAFLVALLLDNTVPGSQQERGVYAWLQEKDARNEPAVLKDYQLPFGIKRLFTWVKWVGL
eukprot:c4572_g1_i2 orf=318-2399(-)